MKSNRYFICIGSNISEVLFFIYKFILILFIWLYNSREIITSFLISFVGYILEWLVCIYYIHPQILSIFSSLVFNLYVYSKWVKSASDFFPFEIKIQAFSIVSLIESCQFFVSLLFHCKLYNRKAFFRNIK